MNSEVLSEGRSRQGGGAAPSVPRPGYPLMTFILCSVGVLVNVP